MRVLHVALLYFQCTVAPNTFALFLHYTPSSTLHSVHVLRCLESQMLCMCHVACINNMYDAKNSFLRTMNFIEAIACIALATATVGTLAGMFEADVSIM
jgi:hypothetical protein